MKEVSAPAARSLLHTRQITCTGYERDDGLWEVEGRLSDVRTHDLGDTRGNHARVAGDPIHLMSLRLTIDDSLLIVQAQAVTHQGPYTDCEQINDAYRQLVGLRIEAGFNQTVKTRFRGNLGCTHLTDLLGPMATTALQTIHPARERRRALTGEPPLDEGPRPRLLDTCHALRRGGTAAIMRWGNVDKLGE